MQAKLNIRRVHGMSIATIGTRTYRVLTHGLKPNNIILLPMISIQDEQMRRLAKRRLSNKQQNPLA
jgi:hypothetical protein